MVKRSMFMKFRTETEILLEMVEKAQENELIAADEEIIEQIQNGELTNNQYILDLSTHAYLLAELEETLSEEYDNSNIDQAKGSAIDTLGELVNVYRYTAEPAIADIIISTPALLEEDTLIPAGTQVILKEFYSSRGYHTVEDVTLIAGTESVNAKIECDEYGYGMNLPIGAVTGLVDFETLVASNTTPGTHGKSIEDDGTYRARIKNWASSNIKGTKACIENYLNSYPGVDEYNLVPLYDGVGSLKIIADTLPTLRDKIQSDVYNNCMLFTDKTPLVVLPETQLLPQFSLEIVLGEVTITVEEIKQIIQNMCQVYVNGGGLRSGTTQQGLHVGENLYPSLLNKFLMEQVPEIININNSLEEIVECAENKKLQIDSIEVII